MNFNNDYVDTWCVTWQDIINSTAGGGDTTTLQNELDYTAGSDCWMITDDLNNMRLPTNLYVDTDVLVSGTVTQNVDTTTYKSGTQKHTNTHWFPASDNVSYICEQNIIIDGNLYVKTNLSAGVDLSSYSAKVPAVPTTINDYIIWNNVLNGVRSTKRLVIKANLIVRGNIQVFYDTTQASIRTNEPNYIKIAERNIADGAIQYNHLETSLLQFFKSMVGMVQYYAASTPPIGWLVCDGSLISRTTYANLFAVIGTTYGTTTSTNFALPDLRGEFLRGWDAGRGIDPTTYSEVASTNAGSDIITALSLNGEIGEGWLITSSVANVIPANTFVLSIGSTGTTVTMTKTALLTNSSQTITFTRVFGSGEQDAFQDHTHGLDRTSQYQSGGGTSACNGGSARDVYTTGVRTGVGYRSYTETRPRNIAMLPLIKY